MKTKSKNNLPRFKNLEIHPFAYKKPSLTSVSIALLVLLCIQILMLFFTGSWKSLSIVACSLTASVLSQLIYNHFYPQTGIAWLSSLIQGILIGLLIPSTYFPPSVLVITFFSLLLCKFTIGNFATSWVNPVALTVCVAYILNISAFPPFLVGLDELQSKNAALSLIQSGIMTPLPFDSAVTSFLNRTVFRLFGIVIPDGYVTMFWDSGSVIPAFRFNFLTLLSSIFLISMDFMEGMIPGIFLLVYTLLVKFATLLFFRNSGIQGDVILSLLTSGTLFSSLFLLQWFGTTPVTLIGKIIYAVLGGIFAFLLMGSGTSSAGYVFTVLILNILSPVIQIAESSYNRKYIEKVLLPKLESMKEIENA